MLCTASITPSTAHCSSLSCPCWSARRRRTPLVSGRSSSGGRGQSDPVPSDRDVDSFVEAVADSGVQLVGLNFFAGELAGPDCGVLSIPARGSEFTDNLDVDGRHR